MDKDVRTLIKNAPVTALRSLSVSEYSQIGVTVDWDADAPSVRKAMLSAASKLNGEALGTLRTSAQRLNALTDELGQSILRNVVHDDELQKYYELENEHDRVIWLFLADRRRFREVEHWWYVDTNRQSRIWDAFEGPSGLEPSQEADHLEEFKQNVLEQFRSAGKVKVEIYTRENSEEDDQPNETIQVLVYREALPTTQLEFEDDDVVSKVVRQVREVALTYQPKTGCIEIVAEGKENRKAVAKIFAQTLLKSPISGENIPLKQYEIQKLLKATILSTDPEDGIEFAKVTLLKVARLNSANSVTLQVSPKEDRTIYEIAEAYFGEHNPLQSGFSLKAARISVRFRPDDQDPRGRMLHVNIRDPNGCDLKEKTQKERVIGDKYLREWGIVKTI